MGKSIITKKCKLDYCKRYLTPESAKGMCSLHYQRLSAGIKLDLPDPKEPRLSIIEGNIAKIPIGTGAKDGYAIVDRQFSWLDKHKWSNCHGYSKTAINKKIVMMHHLIMGKPPQGKDVDHINRDRSDNRLCNLRLVSRSVNLRNSSNRRGKTSKFRGVYLSRGRWVARLSLANGLSRHIGSFDSEIEAAKAYDARVISIYGDEGIYLNNV